MDSTSKSHSSNVGVAIIGAGFCGTMVAVHLLRSSLPQPTIALIDRNNSFGRGVAYRTTDPLHLLNVPAGKMGAFPDDPEHFWKWLQAQPKTSDRQGLKGIDPGSFIPRMVYGDYLETLLRDAERATGRLTRFKEEALDVIPLSDGAFQIMLASDHRIEAEKIVLALGNFPPGDPLLRERRFHTSHFYLHTPWAPATRELLSKPGDVLILGSGLTALDLLLSLMRTKEEGMIHILSQRGLFPHPHKACPAYPSFLQANRLPTTARSLLREVRCEVAHAMEQGIDWRAVVDSLRPFNQALWQGFNLVERRRFMRHVRSYWEPHRHRAAPETLAVKETLESQGKLQCHRGRLTQIAENTEGLHVAFQPLRAKSPEELDVHYVINCTGPECNYHKLKDPLIAQLFARGLIYSDPLLLGVDVGTNGIIHNACGECVRNLHTLGSPQKGRLFETTAVPELRVQAKQLAQQILQELTCETGQLSQLHRHDLVYVYKI